MIARLVSAAVFISLALTAIYFDFRLGGDDSTGHAGLVLVPLAILIAGVGAGELTAMISTRIPTIPASIVIFACALVIAVSSAPMLWTDYPVDCPVGKLGWNTLGILLGIAVVIVFEMIRFGKADRFVTNLAHSLFVVVYIGVLFSFLPALRFFGTNEIGMVALVSLIFIVKFSDAGAFFVGKMLGRRKLAPRMSPAKSVEGALGALLTGGLMALVFFNWIVPLIPGADVRPGIGAILAYGLVIAVTGMVGDLFESVIKRDFQTKDSSRWLPGLGGVLDVFDSVLAAAPAAYLFWAIGLMDG